MKSRSGVSVVRSKGSSVFSNNGMLSSGLSNQATNKRSMDKDSNGMPAPSIKILKKNESVSDVPIFIAPSSKRPDAKEKVNRLWRCVR